jgi:hypothetical protein
VALFITAGSSLEGGQEGDAFEAEAEDYSNKYV